MTNLKKKCDLLVVGGGTAGVACAYTAAKCGLNVILLEKNSFLGGSITSSLVVPAMKTSKNAINMEFFNSLYNELKIVNGAITYGDNNKGWFNPELTKIILDKMLKDAGVDIILNCTIDKIANMLSSYIVTIQDDNTFCLKKRLSSHIDARYIVDATGDAKICEKLNYKFLDMKNNLSQPVSLRFIMSGINSKVFSKWILELDKDRNTSTSYNIGGNIYSSTAYTWDTDKEWALKPLFADAIKKGILKESDSNYFQIFSVAGAPDSFAFNCPRLLEIDKDLSELYIEGRQAILRISNFCIKYLRGFENAYISSISNSLGIRSNKRVKGKYVYTSNDLKSGKKFSSPVVISNYPVDIHSNKKNQSKLQKVEQEYQLPIESLIVDDRLFVAGRCISADFEAIAALRIIPSCFSMGEGLAKYIAKINSQNC